MAKKNPFGYKVGDKMDMPKKGGKTAKGEASGKKGC